MDIQGWILKLGVEALHLHQPALSASGLVHHLSNGCQAKLPKTTNMRDMLVKTHCLLRDVINDVS
jgi:hypothetical protein